MCNLSGRIDEKQYHPKISFPCMVFCFNNTDNHSEQLRGQVEQNVIAEPELKILKTLDKKRRKLV